MTYSRSARAEVLWAKQAEFLIPQAAFGVRHALTSTDPAFVLYQVDRTRLQAVFLNAIVDWLNYGDTERGLRPGLQVSKGTFQLMVRY